MNQVQFLTSELLTHAGITHGWFMRYGGVSKGLFESLNGKKGNGDTDNNVEENRLRALAAICHPELDSGSSCDKSSCLRKNNSMAFIIHSFKTNVNWVTETGEFAGFDGSITDKKDIILGHATADCGSIIIGSTDGALAALVHGSWHTLKAGIIRDVVAKMKSHTPKKLVAGIGPMICQSCYEFGPEAATLFDQKYITLCHPERSAAKPKDPDQKPNQVLQHAQHDKLEEVKYLVNLKQMIVDQLQESGITQIDDLNICTKEDERFFSHRRSGAQSGRFLTLATLTDVI